MPAALCVDVIHAALSSWRRIDRLYVDYMSIDRVKTQLSEAILYSSLDQH